MSLAAIRAALETRLAAVAPELKTAWENYPLSPPALPEAYQEVHLLPAEPDNPAFGPNFYQERGLMQVTLCYPLRSGSKAALARAQLLRDAFPRGTALQIDNRVLVLPGTADNYTSTPDSAAVSITGDLDLRIKVAMDDWALTSSVSPLIYKWPLLGSVDNASYSLFLRGALFPGELAYIWSVDGLSSSPEIRSGVLGFAAFTTKWLRVTHDVDNGAGGNDVRFYLRNDDEAWTQFGSTHTTAGVTSIFDGNAPVTIGANLQAPSQTVKGKVYYAEIRNGVYGPVAASFDPTKFALGALTAAMPTGEVWTINQSGSPKAELKGNSVFIERTPEIGPASVDEDRYRVPVRIRWYANVGS